MLRRAFQLLYRSASCATALLLLSAAVRAAPQIQPLESVREAATRYLSKEMAGNAIGTEFDASALDARLRLAPCPTALEAFAQPTANAGSAHLTVGVRCNGGARWTVYVPVSVSSNVDVLVLKQAVQRGAHLSADDVQLARRRVPGLARDALTSLAALSGKHVRNSLPGGTALSSDMLASDALIKRGQQVMLVASLGGIEVRAVGTALSEVDENGRVRVQNLSSMRIVEGTAESASRVRVSP